jgi:hypothetical protein
MANAGGWKQMIYTQHVHHCKKKATAETTLALEVFKAKALDQPCYQCTPPNHLSSSAHSSGACHQLQCTPPHHQAQGHGTSLNLGTASGRADFLQWQP